MITLVLSTSLRLTGYRNPVNLSQQGISQRSATVHARLLPISGHLFLNTNSTHLARQSGSEGTNLSSRTVRRLPGNQRVEANGYEARPKSFLQLSDPIRRLCITSLPHQKRSASHSQVHRPSSLEEFRDFEPSRHSLLLCFLLAGLFAKNDDDPTKTQLPRLDALLQIGKDNRSLEEQMELFSLLLECGKKRTEGAKGKDIVVVFGKTGAGKSTLVNFLHGCTMVKDGEGNVVVDKNSKVKEVAKIGSGTDSRTLLPEEISNTNDSPFQEHLLTIFDMPGLDDTRGIEVALANLILMKQLLENSKSVRFVMVVEESQVTGVKGTGWKETVELLRDSFRSTLGYGDHSVCVVITKNRDGIDEIKKNIQKFNPKNAPELSKYAVVYNPLKDNYQELFKTVLSLEAYQQLSSKIKLGESQFKAASKLGADVANAVKKHFEKGTLDQAVPKVQFTHRISSLGCEELEVTHGHVVNVIHTCGAEVIKGMKQNNGTEYRPSIGDAYAEYKLFRHHFSPFVPFKSLDQEVKDIINRVKNPDLFDSTSFTKTGIGALGTCGSLAAATAAVLLSGGAVAVAAAVLGAVTTVGSGWWTWESIKRYWNPSEQEKRKSDFFRQDLN